MINSLQDVKNFLNDSNFKKIFLLCGKKSFITSGAEKFVKNETINKEIKFHYKSSEIPTLNELVEIITSIRTNNDSRENPDQVKLTYTIFHIDKYLNKKSTSEAIHHTS